MSFCISRRFVLAGIALMVMTRALPVAAQPAPSPAATATPVAIPATAPVATPGIVPTVTPSASAQPSSGLRLGTSTATVAPRGIVAIAIAGASGAVSVVASNANVGARYDAATSSVIITGIALGNATVTVTDATGTALPLAVSVLPAAGVVPADISVALGGVVSPQFATSKIAAAISRVAQMQAGATLSVRGVTIVNPLHAGDALEAAATVTISAGSAFADQVGTTAVHLTVETLGELEPAFLFYSDDPEKLAADGDGVLYRSTIDATKAARLYAYHVSDTPPHWLWLVLRTKGSASVQILGYASGPADAFAYVGHVSTLQYLLERSTQENSVVDVGARTPYVQPLGYRILNPGELVAAIFDLRVLSGDAVDVEVVATSGSEKAADLIDDPEHAGDGHGRRGEFALANVPPLALTYAAGGPEPDPFSVGYATAPNLRPGGRPLGGDYGLLRSVALQLSNPANTPQNVYFYEQPAGGSATTTIWFAGDARPTEIPCVKVAENRYLVKAFTLDAGETRTISGEYMTDGSSSFPLDFGLTSVPPSPPPGPYSADACNPKAPPATPVPSASPSGSPPAAGSPAP